MRSFWLLRSECSNSLPTFRDNLSFPKMGQVGFSYMSVTHCHYSLCNNPEERISNCYLFITFHTRKLDLNLRKKLVNCYIWSIVFYGAENWTLRKLDQRHLEIFEMWYWRRKERIIWTDNVRSEDILQRDRKKRRKANLISHIFSRNCLLKHVIEGKIGGRIELKRKRRSRRKQLLGDT